MKIVSYKKSFIKYTFFLAQMRKKIMKVLEEYEFSFICPIEPEKDSEGKCIKKYPSSRYAKKNSHKLHSHREPFCEFSIDKKFTENTGVYIFVVFQKTKYVGICSDRTDTDHALRKRMREYGLIPPKGCYDAGRGTDCDKNKKIMECTNKGEVVELYFLELEDRKEINDIERHIIQKCKPPWNL